MKVAGLSKIVSLELRSGLRYRTGEPLPIFETRLYAYTYASNQAVMSTDKASDILAHFPHSSALVALNGADIHGVKQGSLQNVFYWLCGIFDGLDQEYHGGNGAAAKTSPECFREYLSAIRLPDSMARAIAFHILVSNNPSERFYGTLGPKILQHWKLQAELLIKQHSLTTFGDAYHASPLRPALRLVKG